MNHELVKNASYLYVEDDPFSRKLMTLIAENVLGGPTLTIFENSQDLLARMKALPSQPDLIMLDILMKPHNGFEVIEILRADPAYARAKIVALTASVTHDEIEHLKASGFDGVISKPFDLASFAGLIERILNGEAVWHVS